MAPTQRPHDEDEEERREERGVRKGGEDEGLAYPSALLLSNLTHTCHHNHGSCVLEEAYSKLPTPPKPLDHSQLIESHSGEKHFRAVGVA